MNLDQIKSAYNQLQPHEKAHFLQWASGGSPIVVTEETENSSGGIFKTVIIACAVSAFCALVYGGYRYYDNYAQAQAKESKAQRDAREAKEPRNPKNMDYLQKNIGKTVTVQGIPEDYEIGHLYFSSNHSSALQLYCMDGKAVSIQSGDLEDFVKNKTKIEVTGVIEKNADTGHLQIVATNISQIKILK